MKIVVIEKPMKLIENKLYMEVAACQCAESIWGQFHPAPLFYKGMQ